MLATEKQILAIQTNQITLKKSSVNQTEKYFKNADEHYPTIPSEVRESF
jgi:hypothetical protein